MAPATDLGGPTLAGVRGPGPAEAVAVLLFWLLLERAAAGLWPALSSPGRYGPLALVRVAESAGLLCYWRARGWSWDDLGLSGARSRRGWAVGTAWALVLGAVVIVVETVGRAAGGVSLLRTVAGRPGRLADLPALLAVGGVVGPVFEELLFRGVLYTGVLRRFGALSATAVATFLFASAHHSFSGLDPVRAAGGLLFCAAYGFSGSLWAPLILHVTGNLAIFLAPLVLP